MLMSTQRSVGGFCGEWGIDNCSTSKQTLGHGKKLKLFLAENCLPVASKRMELDNWMVHKTTCQAISTNNFNSFSNSVFFPATARQFSVRKSFNFLQECIMHSCFLTVQEFRGAIVISKVSGSHTSFTINSTYWPINIPLSTVGWDWVVVFQRMHPP